MIRLPKQFWLVTKPTETSTPKDIVFRSSLPHLAGQIRNGLTEEEIAGVFFDDYVAAEQAMTMIIERNLNRFLQVIGQQPAVRKAA